MSTNESLLAARSITSPDSEFSDYSREQLKTELVALHQRLSLSDATDRAEQIGHYEWNKDADRLETCSEEYARLFDMTIEEVLEGQNSWDKTMEMIHPDDRPRYAAATQLMESSGVLDVQYRALLKDGGIRHVREYAVSVTDELGVETGSFGLLQDISGQAKTEYDLETRDELARQSEELTDIGHFIFDEASETYSYVSEGFCRIHGSSVEDYLARVNSVEDDLADILSEDRAQVAEQYLRSLTNAEGYALEYRIRRADGAIRWIRELSRPKLVVDGRVRQTLGVIQDITDRVAREQELVFKDAMASQAEVITHIGYFLYDVAENRHLYMSPGYARIAGYGVDELRSLIRSVEDYAEHICEQDRERVRALYNRNRDDLDEWEIEYRLQRPDGKNRWVREVGKPYQHKNGRMIQIIGVIQDISRQKEIEQELLYKDALANQAEEITEIGHFVYDEIKEEYLFVSPGFAGIVGRSVDDLLRRGTGKVGGDSLIHRDDRETVQRAYDRFLSEPSGWRVEYRLVRDDGEIRWVREMGKSHLFSHGIPEQSIGVLQDITDSKNAEQEIIRARDTLEQQVVERTRELANTVKQLQVEIEEREKVTAELHFLANHDALTGLPSLRLCKDRLDQSLAEARRNRQTSAVMFLDLDGFKEINDRYGHEFGDRVLKMTAQRIKDEIRETDTVARIGGDEFVIILSSLPDCSIINRIASSLVEGISQLLVIDQIEVMVSASIGISLYPKNGLTAEELIRSADKAMYKVKYQGKNSFGFAPDEQQD
jgi:diguanylate cyclase (GGDEF)-like protein/PAS domain S-box-containing protein